MRVVSIGYVWLKGGKLGWAVSPVDRPEEVLAYSLKVRTSFPVVGMMYEADISEDGSFPTGSVKPLGPLDDETRRYHLQGQSRAVKASYDAAREARKKRPDDVDAALETLRTAYQAVTYSQREAWLAGILYQVAGRK